MRILICTQPGHGHLCLAEPFVSSLQGDGHQMTVASAPRFAGAAAAMGCDLTPVGIDWLESELDEVFPGARQANSSISIETDIFAGATAEAALPDLMRHIERDPPDLIVRTAWEFSSFVAAAQCGIPLISMNPTMFGRRAFNRMFNKPVAKLAGRRVNAYQLLHQFPSVLTIPSSFVLPSEVVPPNARWCRPHRISASTHAENQVPLVHVSLGTVVHRPALYQMVLDALKPVECDVIVAAPSSVTNDLTAAANVEFHDFISHAELLPKCDLFIHHGGIGSVLASLDHQTPVVVLPGWADQPRNARASVQMGIGNAVATDRQDATSIRAAIVATLGNAAMHRDRLAAVAAELADRPDIATTVDSLLTSER